MLEALTASNRERPPASSERAPSRQARPADANFGTRESQSQGAHAACQLHTANYAAMIFVRDASSLPALLHASSPAIRPCRAHLTVSAPSIPEPLPAASSRARRRAWARQDQQRCQQKNAHDSGARLMGLRLAAPGAVRR